MPGVFRQAWFRFQRRNVLLPSIDISGRLKYWNGSAWVSVAIRHGASWPEINLKRWNGSAWVNVRG